MMDHEGCINICFLSISICLFGGGGGMYVLFAYWGVYEVYLRL